MLATVRRYGQGSGKDCGRNSRDPGLPGLCLMAEKGGSYFLSTSQRIILRTTFWLDLAQKWTVRTPFDCPFRWGIDGWAIRAWR